jgi:Ca2+-binding EF-hand superfamily protein
VTPSRYTDKLFDMIDSDKSGMMDFSEFICILVVRVRAGTAAVSITTNPYHL